jgi:hypothetical protein
MQTQTQKPVEQKKTNIVFHIALWLSLLVIITILYSLKKQSDSMQAPVASSAPVTAPTPTPSAPATPLLSNQEKLQRAKEAARTGTQPYTVETLLAQIPESDPTYKEAKPLLDRARKQITEREGPDKRERLKESYKAIIATANSHLNYIDAKVVKSGKGYAIFVQHEFFSQYSFSAGDEAKLTSAWIAQNRDALEMANVVKVGLMGKGPYSSSCWLELK